MKEKKKGISKLKILLAVIIVVLVIIVSLTDFITDFMWFGEMGYTSVFLT